MKMWCGAMTDCHWSAWSVWCVGLLLLVLSDHFPLSTASRSHDIHGGIQMGVSSHLCDDAKTNLSMDWDPTSPGADIEYRCPYDVSLPVNLISPQKYCQLTTDEPLHQCMFEPIHYPDTPPLSGAHRPLWPVYGEYVYLPPQRWLHSMEHGGVVLLYHPCANQEELGYLKDVVRSCLRRHVITPYRHLPTDTPFALLTWGCKLTMGYVDQIVAENFIVEHAIARDLPEWKVYQNGQFDLGLDRPAEIVTDLQDSIVCPQFSNQNSNWIE